MKLHQFDNLTGWHGSSEKACFQIAENNFLDPTELAVSKQTDPGYFGKGIYFTQFPSYGSLYADKEKQCMLVSWVMMGKPYPVIESPTDPPDVSLLGKSCVPGYNSHYAVVKQKGS